MPLPFIETKRSKKSLASGLEGIVGIGPKTIDTLLKQFRSIKNIRAASVEELAQHIGHKKATLLKEGLNSMEESVAL